MEYVLNMKPSFTIRSGIRKIAEPLKITGKEVDIKILKMLLDSSIGYLSEDRKRQWIVDMTIANNTVMANLDKYIKVV